MKEGVGGGRLNLCQTSVRATQRALTGLLRIWGPQNTCAGFSRRIEHCVVRISAAVPFCFSAVHGRFAYIPRRQLLHQSSPLR